MPRNKGKLHAQLDTLPGHIIWHTTPPTPAQLAAWRQLWARLLGHVDPYQETRQPQDPVEPGAAGTMTVSSGHDLIGEQDDYITIDSDNQ